MKLLSSTRMATICDLMLKSYITFLAVVCIWHMGSKILGKRELEKERTELSAKTAMWVGVESPPKFGDLLKLTFNWMYAAKLKLEEKGQNPDLVDPTMKELPQLSQLLAIKGYGGATGPTWSSGITLREYLGMSSADFQTAYNQFKAEDRKKYIWYLLGACFGALIVFVFGIFMGVCIACTAEKHR